MTRKHALPVMTISLDRVLAYLDTLPFLAAPVRACLARHGDAYGQALTAHVAKLCAARQADTWDKVEWLLDDFIEMTVETMRLQHQYTRGGAFRSPDAGPDMYTDEAFMNGRYLNGLYLAQYLWPNHFEKMQFFQESFVPRLAGRTRLMDVGSGHGTFLFEALSLTPQLTATALDISPHSLRLIERLRACWDMPAGRLECRCADFADYDERLSFHAAIFSEVVEHLADPAGGLRALAASLDKDAPVFFTTATNAAFYDHTIVFADVGEIEALIRTCGFRIEATRTIAANLGGGPKPIIDYCAILYPSAEPRHGQS